MSSSKNILIISAGRRVSLVKAFMLTALAFDKDIKVFAADKDPSLAAACHVTDECFKVRPVLSDGFVDDMLGICQANGVGIVVPTIDTCLPVLAGHKSRFEAMGVSVIVPDTDFVELCRDKRKTFEFFAEHDIRPPRLVDIASPTFPMFVKPYDGSSSIGARAIMSEDDLPASMRCDERLMFMECIDRTAYKEFTVDMYYGRDHRVKAIVPRERIATRGGEVSKSATRRNGIVPFINERLGHLQGVAGVVCIQLFYREADHDIVGIEINPRFGGGYPLSYRAGANFPRMILEEYLQHKPLSYSDRWRDNLLMLRYDAEVMIEP